mmetsp:Transcript_68072/g.154010  ORF Transcript_68072/g.154010 Transcript_68072/m.154010 type:complete len:213 (-) Transcript_68072:196-834(-)
MALRLFLATLICSHSVSSFLLPKHPRSVTRALQSSEESAAVSFEIPEFTPNPAKLEFKPRTYFYGRCTISIGEGYKPMTETFSPSFKDDECSLACVEIELPMGMVIEESADIQGRLEVVEVMEGSNAEFAGVKVGDLLRACTAQKTDAYAAANGNIAFNVLGGGTTAGVEMNKRALYTADGRPLEGCLEAIGTNSEDNQGPGTVGAIFERKN